MFNGTLKVGNEYELNNGEVWECMEMYGDDPLSEDEFGCGPFQLNGVLYHQDGRFADQDISNPLSVRQCVKGTLADIDAKPGDVVRHVAYFDGRDDVFQGELVINSELCPCAFGDEMFGSDSRSIFRLISRAADTTDTPTIFRDMTDAEKGALLLAAHGGAVIEYYSDKNMEWVCVGKPSWVSGKAYRIKPEPTTETVKYTGGLHFGGRTLSTREYEITMDFMDNKPQLLVMFAWI